MRLKMKLKLIVDIFLFLAGLATITTGLILLFSPSGPGTQAGQIIATSLFDFTNRSVLKLFHNWSSILIIGLIIFRLILNWRIILCYFKNAFKINKAQSCENPLENNI